MAAAEVPSAVLAALRADQPRRAHQVECLREFVRRSGALGEVDDFLLEEACREMRLVRLVAGASVREVGVYFVLSGTLALRKHREPRDIIRSSVTSIGSHQSSTSSLSFLETDEQNELFSVPGLAVTLDEGKELAAVGDCDVALISRRVMETNSSRRAAAETLDKLFVLRMIDSSFNDDQLSQLAAAMEPDHVPTGTVLLREASPPAAALILRRGEASVLVERKQPSSSGRPTFVLLGTESCGAVFGARAILMGEVAGSSVVTDSPCFVYRIRGPALLKADGASKLLAVDPPRPPWDYLLELIGTQRTWDTYKRRLVEKVVDEAHTPAPRQPAAVNRVLHVPKVSGQSENHDGNWTLSKLLDLRARAQTLLGEQVSAAMKEDADHPQDALRPIGDVARTHVEAGLCPKVDFQVPRWNRT